MWDNSWRIVRYLFGYGVIGFFLVGGSIGAFFFPYWWISSVRSQDLFGVALALMTDDFVVLPGLLGAAITAMFGAWRGSKQK